MPHRRKHGRKKVVRKDGKRYYRQGKSGLKEGGLTSADKDLVTLRPTQIPISRQNFTGNPFLSVSKRFESILRFKVLERYLIFCTTFWFQLHQKDRYFLLYVFWPFLKISKSRGQCWKFSIPPKFNQSTKDPGNERFELWYNFKKIS